MPGEQHINHLIQHLSRNLGLLYIKPEEATGEVCYANEPTLRPEFRQSFTLQHVKSYLHTLAYNPALLQQYAEQLKTGDNGVVYPISAEVFWKLVDSSQPFKKS